MFGRLARFAFWRAPDARLAEFAETEAFGARDLARAAESFDDPWIRRQLLLHAQDEVRHAALLAEAGTPPASPGLGARVGGEVAGAEGIDAETMGQVGFLAFVHDAEARAVREFEMHQAALAERGEVFRSILVDERRHVAWTRHALDRYEEEGRRGEVARALRRVRLQRLLGAWMRVARAVSLVTSTLLLSLIFFAGLLPFLPARGRWAKGWRPGSAVDTRRQF